MTTTTEQSNETLPGRLQWCSSVAGWRSLQIRHYAHDRTVDDFRTTATDDQLIVLVVKGSTVLQSFSGGRWRSAQHRVGCLGMTAPDETARLRWEGQQMHETLHLRLPGPLVRAALADSRDSCPGVCSLPNDLSSRDPAVEAVMRSLVRKAREGAPDLYAESAGHFLIQHLVAATDIRRRSLSRPGREVARLRRIDEFMRSHLDEDISLDALAAVADCGPYQLIRICKAHWDETPFQRLTALRMARGRELLDLTDQSIILVALACGYANPSHFATAFRRVVGVSPSEYRHERWASQ